MRFDCRGVWCWERERARRGGEGSEVQVHLAAGPNEHSGGGHERGGEKPSFLVGARLLVDMCPSSQHITFQASAGSLTK